MYIESIVIVVICIILEVVLLRKNFPDYALFMLPVFLIPVCYLASFPVFKYFKALFPALLERSYVIVIMCILGLFFSTLIIALNSIKIKLKRKRNLYFFLTGGYCAALACIYIINSLLAVL